MSLGLFASSAFAILLGVLAVRSLSTRFGTGRRDTRAARPGARLRIGDLQVLITHYVGAPLMLCAFEAYVASRGLEFDPSRDADKQDIRFAERLLVSAIGEASARLVFALLQRRDVMAGAEVVRLVDGISAEIRRSHDWQYQAIGYAQQGMAFYDRDLRLVAWNQCRDEIFILPPGILHVGARLEDILRACAEQGCYGPGAIEDLVEKRLAEMLDTDTVKRTRTKHGRVFDMRSVRMPDGALFTMYMDITAQAAAEEQLEAANQRLERRVRERTDDLERLNAALETAKAEAEEANVSKTRFIAAASHDLLQPLNAARLYATSLKERLRSRARTDDSLALALNVEDSLEAVEDILTALLDISRLDAGAIKSEISVFEINDLFRQLQLEFCPIASEKGLSLRFVPSSLTIASDWRLLRRLLQNLVSNAVKYTLDGRVTVGARRCGDIASIQVWDTGLGIPKSKHRDIFKEFERLPDAAMTAPGVGLGLSIVERLSRILDHEITLRSSLGSGSVFCVAVPRAPALALPRLGTGSGTVPIRQRSLKGLVIAVIDNEPTILSGMEALLGGWDCMVVTGVDLLAIERGLSEKSVTPDVILADYHLCGIDGLAVIDALRSRYGFCQAVIVTADRGAHVRDSAHAADIRILNKPIKPAALRSLLSQWRLVKLAAE